MDPPKSKTTMRISTNMGPASRYANSPMRVVELKGRTPQEKGDHYLQLSLGALQELASLLEDTRLSKSEKVAYNKVYDSSMVRYDALVQLRDQLLSQKKSFRKFLVNLFVRESEVSRFHRMSFWNYSTLRRTSDEVHRRLLGVRDAALALGSEESPRDVVEGNTSANDLPPNETLRGINLDVHTEEEENDALRVLNRIATLAGGGEDDDVDDDDDGSNTIVPSRPPSPSPSLTIIQYTNNIINSVVAFHSEVTNAAINNGSNEDTVLSNP